MRRIPLLAILFLLPLALPAGCGGEDDGGPGDVVEANCSGPTPHAFEDNCVECLVDDHCTGSQTCSIQWGTCGCPSATPRFDGENCYECLESTDCPGQKSCDLGSKTCAELACPEDHPHLLNGGCVVCVNNGQCQGEMVCGIEDHNCACPEAAQQFVDGKCVDCAKSSECAPGEMCEDGTCMPFESPCPDGTPYKLGIECYECLEDAHCTGNDETCHAEKYYCIPPELVCEGKTPHKYLGACVQCLDNSHCPEGQHCNKSEHTCIDDPISSGECVYAGTGSLVGNKIGDFTATDCNGNTLSLHSFCGEAKAVWLITVAGWCGACDEYAPQANATWLQYKDQGLQLIFVLGEDPPGNPPSPAYCQQWAESHSVTAPVMLDAHWTGLDSKITPSGFDLPWDYLLDGDDMTYVWESVTPDGAALQAEIQKLLAD